MIDADELKEFIKNEQYKAMTVYKQIPKTLSTHVADGFLQACEEILQYIEDNE